MINNPIDDNTRKSIENATKAARDAAKIVSDSIDLAGLEGLKSSFSAGLNLPKINLGGVAGI